MNDLNGPLSESVWGVILSVNEEKFVALDSCDFPCVTGAIVVEDGCTDDTAFVA